MIRRTATALLSVLLVGACTTTAATGQSTASRPNIVLVLTDDLSLNLLPYLPQAQALAKEGTTFAPATP